MIDEESKSIFYEAENPQVVQSFINALVESIALMKKDRAGALPVLKDQLSLEDDAIVAATYDFFAKSVVPSVPLPGVLALVIKPRQ